MIAASRRRLPDEVDVDGSRVRRAVGEERLREGMPAAGRRLEDDEVLATQVLDVPRQVRARRALEERGELQADRGRELGPGVDAGRGPAAGLQTADLLLGQPDAGAEGTLREPGRSTAVAEGRAEASREAWARAARAVASRRGFMPAGRVAYAGPACGQPADRGGRSRRVTRHVTGRISPDTVVVDDGNPAAHGASGRPFRPLALPRDGDSSRDQRSLTTGRIRRDQPPGVVDAAGRGGRVGWNRGWGYGGRSRRAGWRHPDAGEALGAAGGPG